MTTLSNIIFSLTFLMTFSVISIFAQSPADDLLAGPSVQDEVVTQEDMRSDRARVTGKGQGQHQSREQMRLWLMTLQSVDLDTEQQIEVRALVQQLREAQAAFEKKYGKEMSELRKKTKEVREKGGDVPENIGTRTRELMELAPDQTKYQTKAWSLLTEDQQSNFQEKYQAAIEAQKKRLEARKGKGNPKADGDELRGNRIAPKGSEFRDRKVPLKEDLNVASSAAEEVALRRIRFLRRLATSAR